VIATKQHVFQLYLMLVFAAGCSPAASPNLPARTTADSREFAVEKALAAESALHFSEALEDLFRNATPEQVERLSTHRHPTIAAAAVWQKLRSSLSSTDAVKTTQKLESGLRDFASFLKKRIEMALPDWWEASLMCAQWDAKQHISVGSGAYPPYQESGTSFLVPMDTSIDKQGTQALLKVGQESQLLPFSALTFASDGDARMVFGDSISACFTPSKCFIARHRQFADAYVLGCLDRFSGRTQWTCRVFSEGIANYFGSGHRHYVTIVAKGERVFVFGGGSCALYVEGFKVADGTRVFYFRTD
jgi:hypothetical protein